jgi:CRP/FNR family transcriptional regulator, nitrogen fixation regulation protein
MQIGQTALARRLSPQPTAPNGCLGHVHRVSDAIGRIGTIMSFARNTEIFGEGEPAEYVYKIVRGAARTYKVLADGRRQVGGFHLAGEMFGLGTGSEHAFSAETVTECKIVLIKRRSLLALAGRDQEVAQELWELAGCELRRLQDHIMLLIKNAPERVAAFLLEMAERKSPGDIIELPMSRQDIADYLGMTIETVSRTLTQLENDSTIELSSRRRVVLRNRSALTRLNA